MSEKNTLVTRVNLTWIKHAIMQCGPHVIFILCRNSESSCRKHVEKLIFFAVRRIVLISPSLFQLPPLSFSLLVSFSHCSTFQDLEGNKGGKNTRHGRFFSQSSSFSLLSSSSSLYCQHYHQHQHQHQEHHEHHHHYHQHVMSRWWECSSSAGSPSLSQT